MKRNFLWISRAAALLSFFGAITFTVGSASANQRMRCSQVFSHRLAPKSIHHYLRQVEEENNKSLNPRFLDPKNELELVSQWQGTRDVPRAIKDTLLDSTALLDFQLLAADAGSVKSAQPGSFTSMRLNHKWQGKDMSTNLGLPVDALVIGGLRKSSQLVPENAKAVFIFMHGGGTKTTGHHVAAALANFMAPLGILVISIDAPFHAYGPRTQNLSPLEYYKYLRDFRHEFIPKKIPTFIGGHSMGGLHADNIMRLSDRAELGFKEAFEGLVNLSGPMDAAPGKSLKEKAKREDEITSNRELMELVPEAERDLSVLLLTQGKTSALSGMSTEMFGGIVNWTKPKHGGSEYIPTLAVMGARDALVIGKEQIWKDHVEALSNTTTLLMGQRKDFKGEDMWVSHMIFDHYKNGTELPETFHAIKDFIQERLGEELKSPEGHNHPLYQNYDLSQIGIVGRVVQEYYNNLAFRKFAEQYSLITRGATEKMAEIGQKTAELSKLSKTKEKELKRVQKEQASQEQIDRLQSELNEIRSEWSNLRDLQQSTFVPKEGELSQWAADNIATRNTINQQIRDNLTAKKAIKKELNQARSQKDQKQKKVHRWTDRVVDLSGFESAEAARQHVDNFNATDRKAFGLYWGTEPAVAKVRRDYQQALKEMVDLQIKMNEASSREVTERVERSDFTIDPSPQLIKIFKQLDASYANYNAKLKVFREQVQVAIAQGRLGPELQQDILDLWGSAQAIQSGKPAEGSLKQLAEAKEIQAEKIEVENSRLNKELNALLLSYIARITPDLFNVEVTTLRRELDRPLEELVGNSSNIERLWKDWQEIWKERPPEQDTSLY